MYISRMCKLFIKDQQPVKVPEDFKYSLRCATNTIFISNEREREREREREERERGVQEQTKGQRTYTDRRADGPTDERTNRHTYTDKHQGLKCNNAFRHF